MTPAIEPRFRVWILHCAPWQPQRADDVPPQAIVLEPAEEDCFSEVEARDYVRGFNSAPERPRSLWAIRIPVELRVDRDTRPGALIGAPHPRKAPREEC